MHVVPAGGRIVEPDLDRRGARLRSGDALARRSVSSRFDKSMDVLALLSF